MKRRLLLLTTMVLVLFAAGCGKRPDTPKPQQEKGLVQLESLRLEILREAQDPQQLLEAVRQLPEALQDVLAHYGVEVGEVVLTVGSAQAATVQALEEGSVDLAVFPAEELAKQVTTLPVALTSGVMSPDRGEELAEWNRAPETVQEVPWQRTILCAGPSMYGKNLAQRPDLSWEEVSRGRWGVLAEDSLSGHGAVNLWLADHYEGNTLEDLSDVTVYEDFESLLEAASREEIDLFPMLEKTRLSAEERWMRAAEEDGLGRPDPIWREVPVVGLGEPFFDRAVAACPSNVTLADPQVLQAIASAVNDLCGSDDERIQQLARGVFGENSYALAPEDALAAFKRLAVIS